MKRKTRDVYRLYVDYGYGYELELEEFTAKEARQRLREYAENCPQYPAYIKKGRERIVKVYKYGMRLRGFSPGCQPSDGLQGREDDPEGKYHDVIIYSRPLSSEERRDYELDYIGSEEVA